MPAIPASGRVPKADTIGEDLGPVRAKAFTARHPDQSGPQTRGAAGDAGHRRSGAEADSLLVAGERSRDGAALGHAYKVGGAPGPAGRLHGKAHRSTGSGVGVGVGVGVDVDDTGREGGEAREGDAYGMEGHQGPSPVLWDGLSDDSEDEAQGAGAGAEGGGSGEGSEGVLFLSESEGEGEPAPGPAPWHQPPTAPTRPFGEVLRTEHRPRPGDTPHATPILADNFFWASRIVIRIRVTFWTRVLRNYARITNDAVHSARNGVRETCFGGHESSA